MAVFVCNVTVTRHISIRNFRKWNLTLNRVCLLFHIGKHAIGRSCLSTVSTACASPVLLASYRRCCGVGSTDTKLFCFCYSATIILCSPFFKNIFVFYFFYFYRFPYTCVSIFLWHWYLLNFLFYFFQSYLFPVFFLLFLFYFVCIFLLFYSYIFRFHKPPSLLQPSTVPPNSCCVTT